MRDHQALVPRGLNLPETAPSIPVLDIEAQEFDSSSYLQTYWNVINKRRWTIVTVTFIVTLLVAIASFKMTPVYEATVRLDIEADTLQIQSLNDLFRQIPTDDAFIGTQIQVLEGDSLAERTIEQLRLAKDPSRSAAILQANSLFPAKPPISPDGLLAPFERCLHVEKVRDSHVVTVSFQSADPGLSAQIATALANNYIEYNFREKYDATRQASGWMEHQLDELKAKVEKSQQALVDYERQNLIINIGDKQNITEQRLQDLSRDYTTAQSDRVQKESAYELAKSNEGQIGIIVQNELLLRLEEKYSDLKTAYAEAQAQYGPNFPKVLRLRDQLNETQSLIEKEHKQAIQKVRNDYLAAVGRENLLATALAKQKAEVGQLNQRMIEHNILKREFETNQQLYENLLQRLKDATLSAGLQATNIHVIDPAKVPQGPIRPNKARNIFAGLLMSLILGITLAFVQEAVDTSIKTIDEGERLANAPALAVVPLASGTLRRPSSSLPGDNGTAGATQGLALLSQPSSALAESFRTLLTSVVLSTAPQPPQALLITSSTANEGKTSTALNLAIALAQRGEPTLLIDADLRHPTVAESLNLGNGKGLASFLTGAHSIEEALRQFPPVPTLWALPAGPKPPNPAQLLSSSAMESMLRELRKQFKFLVIDSPPVLPVADAMVLSTFVDGVVFVIESGATARGAVTRARKILQNVGAKVLGIVLNKVDVRHDGYYGYHNHYYYHSGDSERTEKAEAVSA